MARLQRGATGWFGFGGARIECRDQERYFRFSESALLTDGVRTLPIGDTIGPSKFCLVSAETDYGAPMAYTT